jgi:hypothetical protein
MRRGNRRIDEHPKSIRLAHEGQSAFEAGMTTTRHAQAAHVMRFSIAQGAAISALL